MTSGEFDFGAGAPVEHARNRSFAADVFVVEWEVVHEERAPAASAAERARGTEAMEISLEG